MAIIYAMEDEGYKAAKQVKKAYPAAVVVKRVTGGWAVFETWTDYEVWRRQK